MHDCWPEEKAAVGKQKEHNSRRGTSYGLVFLVSSNNIPKVTIPAFKLIITRFAFETLTYEKCYVEFVNTYQLLFLFTTK